MSMKYPLANAVLCIDVKYLSNNCVRSKIYSVMKKCESKTMPYIHHDAPCLVLQLCIMTANYSSPVIQ